ncbi:dynein axonemal intermediate chain 7-like isoform X1 [Mytilus trossulus]|uniref:dynein axonemal intermediate chain 7-like isoform X1 n=1 Tax=Mytilus trossulus TaxID=6551 RepID=UPI003007918A
MGKKDKPPKSAQGKQKLSKAEKEKLKAEEEARRAEEEEENRKKALEEEKERKVRQKEQEAERKQQENEEKKTRMIEMTQLDQLQEANREALHNLHDERRKKAKWARYMRCDGSPDPTVPGEINTYINLRLEDNEVDSIEQVLKKCELDSSLINELEYLLEDTPKEELTDRDKANYKETMGELQTLMKLKVDGATLRLLQEATDRADPETFNLQYAIKTDDVTLSVWGNLSKNPRIKSFEFTKQGLTFEIPRQQTLSDCAVRVLDPKYDHYSPTCKSFYPRQKVKEVPVVAEPAPEEQTEEKKEDEEEKKEEEPEQVEKEETDLNAYLKDLNEENKEEEEAPKEEEKVEEVIEEYENPKTPEPVEWEDFEEDDDVIDLRAYNIVGGVFHFDLMQLPPQPKVCNKWTITRLVDPPEIEYIDYVADTVATSPKENQSSGNTPTQADKRDEKPAIGVMMKLPEDVLFCEEPLVARWDHKRKHWRQDGFTDPKYNEENRTFSFKTAYYGNMALLQDTHQNMPFQCWDIRPHKTNAAVFSITAAIAEIEIEIKDAMCCLSKYKPEERPELDHIMNKWVTPKELIKLMRLAGVNVFPAEDSSKYVSIRNKHPIIVDKLYQQIALTASAMAFSSSRWNNEEDEEEEEEGEKKEGEKEEPVVGGGKSEKVLFQAFEPLADEPVTEDEWNIFMMTKTRTMVLELKEDSDAYNEDIKVDSKFRSNLYHLSREEFCSNEGQSRIDETSFEFVDCVYQLLSATKVVTYSL